MPKADKATASSRVTDVFRLLLAGAEFADIRQFATSHGWNVGDRQVRRYMEMAYKRFAEATQRDRKQLLGRHLMQRRALYARAIKSGDIRTALQVLRDEAILEGLYPPTKVAPTTPDGQHPYLGYAPPALSRRERVVRLLASEGDNSTERRLIEQVTPHISYSLRDTDLPTQMLNIMAMAYVAEQLDTAALCLAAMFSQTRDPDADHNQKWELVAAMSAYRFREGREGWRRFCEWLGIDGDALVRGNYSGGFLAIFDDSVCAVAPSFEELQTIWAASRSGPEESKEMSEPTAAKNLARSWRQMFEEVCQK